MKYDLTKPCKTCPFLRSKGAVRLTVERAQEIGGNAINQQGTTFVCHNTAGYDDESGDLLETKDSKHCAGALIFAEKQNCLTQTTRVAERLGMYDRDKLMANKKVVASVFDSLEEMIETNREAGTP